MSHDQDVADPIRRASTKDQLRSGRTAGRRLLPVLLAALGLLLAACSGSTGSAAPQGQPVLFVVSAPLTSSPWIGRFVENGAKLAAEQLNAAGGVGGRPVKVDVLDNAGSPQRSVANAREAVSRGAAALLTDGVGAVAVSDVSGPAKVPSSSCSREAARSSTPPLGRRCSGSPRPTRR